jgi:hypothetical protein
MGLHAAVVLRWVTALDKALICDGLSLIHGPVCYR